MRLMKQEVPKSQSHLEEQIYFKNMDINVKWMILNFGLFFDSWYARPYSSDLWHLTSKNFNVDFYYNYFSGQLI